MAAPDRGRSAIDLYCMPPLTIENVDETGLENLKAAIILDACKAYVRACHLYKHAKNDAVRQIAERRIQEEAIFFRSGWLKTLGGEDLDGEKVMHVLRYDTPRKWLTQEERRELDAAEKRSAADGLSDDDGEGIVRSGAGSMAGGKASAWRSGKKCDRQSGAYDSGRDPGQLGQADGPAAEADSRAGAKGGIERAGSEKRERSTGGGFCATVLRGEG
jgi:hypothetical protein